MPKSVNSGPQRVGERFSYYLPTPAPHSARHSALDKEKLAGIRDDLVHLLSVSWADIGWHLRHAKSREDLRQAFEPLRGRNNHPLIERFLRTTLSTTTGEELRLTRNALADAIKWRYRAQAMCNDPAKSDRKAETSVMQSRAEPLAKLRREPAKHRSKLLGARKELRSAQALERTLEKQLAE